MSKYAKLFKSPDRADHDRTDTGTRQNVLQENVGTFTLLFVDDEESILKSLKRIFIEENYTILTAMCANEALDIMRKHRVHLVVSDHRMPGMTGAQLLKEIKANWPETIRIMLTGYADVQSIMGAVNEGAVYKFITKPWNDEDLRLTVSLALQQYVLIQENKKLKDITKRQQDKIKNISSMMRENRAVLSNFLLKLNIVTQDQLILVRERKNQGEFIIDTLVRLGITTEAKAINALQTHLNIEFIDLKETHIAPEIVRFLPRDICEKKRLVPVRLESKQLLVAMADPTDIPIRDNIEFMTGMKVIPYVARNEDIQAKLEKIYGGGDSGIVDDADLLDQLDPIDEIDVVIDEEEDDYNIPELMESSEIPPIIRIVNAIITEGIRHRASDIHIEPKTKFTLIRYRIDGMLHNKIKIPADLHLSTISRIKILAKLDIAERRKPQDGRITVKMGERIVDLRISSMPTINGEKIVMRILDKKASVKRIDEVGILTEDFDKVQMLIKKPQGIIISTGPTGSGKTTFLYSLLNAMLENTKNSETIEDPVEYFLEDATQVHVLDKVGLSFASVLRSTLRQDPDIILVGEIRDLDTADVVFKAGLTGHMVLTTLHTNNSLSTINRLIDIGIQPYLIASALEGIVAQRLVRTLCKNCREETEPDSESLAMLNIPPDTIGKTIYKARGCQRCDQTGYSGRTGLFEIFTMNDEFRHLISSADYRESELQNLARGFGMKTLLEDGIEKVRRGITTLDELIRVVGPQTRNERQCGKCSMVIDAQFPFCPYCGTFKQNICNTCKAPLEVQWKNCPFCGTKRPED